MITVKVNILEAQQGAYNEKSEYEILNQAEKIFKSYINCYGMPNVEQVDFINDISDAFSIKYILWDFRTNTVMITIYWK